MAKDNDKRFCVIDHANKAAEREGTNPNRGARRKLSRRWSDTPGDPINGKGRRVGPDRGK